MSPWRVFEPTYAELKSRIVTGHWQPGERLEVSRLASELGVSVTPVRESLNRLVGERLVALEYGHGFSTVRLTEQDLRDLLAFNLGLLLSACALRTGPDPAVRQAETATGIAVRSAQLFEQLAADSGNGELVEAMCSLNDRLHAVRNHDDHVLVDAEAELTELEGTGGGDLAVRLVAFHDRRSRAAASFIRRLEQRLP